MRGGDMLCIEIGILVNKKRKQIAAAFFYIIIRAYFGGQFKLTVRQNIQKKYNINQIF